MKELLKIINRDSYMYTCLLGINPEPSFHYLVQTGPREI